MGGYQVVDARGDALELLVHRLDDGRLRRVPPRAGWVAPSVFGRQFRLERTRDRRDSWEFTLVSR